MRWNSIFYLLINQSIDCNWKQKWVHIKTWNTFRRMFAPFTKHWRCTHCFLQLFFIPVSSSTASGPNPMISNLWHSTQIILNYPNNDWFWGLRYQGKIWKGNWYLPGRHCHVHVKGNWHDWSGIIHERKKGRRKWNNSTWDIYLIDLLVFDNMRHHTYAWGQMYLT